MTIVVPKAETELVLTRATLEERDLSAIGQMLVELHGDVGVARLNIPKMIETVVSVVSEGMTWIVWAGDQAVGTLGLSEAGLYYSDEVVIHDKWFYVVPERRGRVGVKLLAAARIEGTLREKIVYIYMTNPDKGERRAVGVPYQRIGFVPAGYRMKLTRGQTHGPHDRNQVDLDQ